MIAFLLRYPRIIMFAGIFTMVSALAGGIYLKGRSDAASKAQVEQLSEQNRQLSQQLSRNDAATLADKRRAAADAKKISEYEDKVDELLRNIEKPDTECLSGADTKRLLDAWDVFSGKSPTKSSK